MQPENNPIDIATIIDDTDNLIRRINAHLEELEDKYNIEKKKTSRSFEGEVFQA